MWLKIVSVLCVVSYLSNEPAYTQEIPERADTTHLYENIGTYSEKNKFTQFMFRLFFKPVAPALPVKTAKLRPLQKPYSAFEGKIIRNIDIETLDPFGYSIGDTITASLNALSKAGNRLHVKTHSGTIRNLLLFRRNQPFDSLLVKESERLVRSMAYITDVSFYVRTAAESADSVDIYIRELDTWSILPGGSISENRISLSLTDNNFMGLGHEFQHGLIWNHRSGDYAYRTKYYIPNIYNTYINSTLQYGSDEYGNFIKHFALDRPFFSPFAKWAAGIHFSQHLRKDSIWSSHIMQFKYNAQDYWAGNAIRIFRGNSEYYRTTHFISAARFIRIRYLEMPPETIDTLRFFSNENFYLASIGISTRLYVQDKYIFKFGLTEDVPVGMVLGLTGGIQEKNSAERFYLGARISSGKYHPWGYLSSNIEYGTFFRSSNTEQGVFSAGANYFTHLKEIGRWKFRQFVKPEVIFGINRTEYDSLTINDGYGLDGFNSPVLAGTSRLLFTLQTQSYAPWNFIGFHFGPYFILSLAALGEKKNGFRSAKVYSQIGLGVLIKNNNLVMNTFQLSVAFYPVIPGKGNNILKFNSFQTSDFGFRDFEIGKPAPVVFR
jgi:hypothetical protein